MKARIKTTGEILDIASYATIAMDTCDSWGNPIEFSPEEVELITEEDLNDKHWQDVRERTAIAAMQSIISSNLSSLCHDHGFVARDAIRFADALIEQLKKK